MVYCKTVAPPVEIHPAAHRPHRAPPPLQQLSCSCAFKSKIFLGSFKKFLLVMFSGFSQNIWWQCSFTQHLRQVLGTAASGTGSMVPLCHHGMPPRCALRTSTGWCPPTDVAVSLQSSSLPDTSVGRGTGVYFCFMVSRHVCFGE